MTTIESEYPSILNKLLKYIVNIKEKDKDICILDIVLEYCMKEGQELELIGDVISTDEYLKKCIDYDLNKHHYSKSNIILEDW